MGYYDSITGGYDELHAEEQARKFELILEHVDIEAEVFVLDVGCGTGLSRGHIPGKIVGIDPALEPLGLAKPRLSAVLLASAEQLPFKSNSFKYVISITAVHNFNDIRAGLTEIARVASGTVTISILKRSHKFEMIIENIHEIFQDWGEVIRLKDDPIDEIFIISKP